MSILIAKYPFVGPYFNTNLIPATPGIYAIADSRMRILDVGESQNISARVSNHDRASCWTSHATGTIAAWVYVMPGSTPEQRRAVEEHVRLWTAPTCGVK